jgi:hypothetical protein
MWVPDSTDMVRLGEAALFYLVNPEEGITTNIQDDAV